jgi:hypothetical protein
MKFPEGGIFLRELVWLRNRAVRVDNQIPETAARLKWGKAAPAVN